MVVDGTAAGAAVGGERGRKISLLHNFEGPFPYLQKLISFL